MNRRSTLAAAVVATAAMAGTSTSVEAFSPVVSRTPAKPTAAAAATALRMSTADDEVAKLRAAAQKAREEAQALAKVSPMHFLLSSIRDHVCVLRGTNSIDRVKVC